MRVGMLWFDDNKTRSIEERVRRAADHYQRKYGTMPTLCYVHPSMLAGDKLTTDGIKVCTANTVLPHHFWLGQDEGKRRKSAA